MRYTLKQLRVFLATTRLGTLSKAAESLFMSQSAASAALHDLEQRYDTLLFERAGKNLKINELGKILKVKAEILIAQAEEIDQLLQGDIQEACLSIGATMTIGNYLVVDIMAYHMKKYSKSDLSLHVANTEQITRDVLNFDLDIGLVEGEVWHKDLELISWREDELQVFCSPNHPLAGKTTITDDDLMASQWILRESGSGTRQTFDRAMHGLIPRLKLHLELEHTEAIKRAVESNLGIGCLSKIALQPAIDRGNLVALPVPHRNMKRNFYFAMHRQKFHSKAIESWINSCRQFT